MLRRTMLSRSGRIGLTWLLGQMMFAMDLKDPAPARAACRSVLDVMARRISPAATRALDARLPRALRPLPVPNGFHDEPRLRPFTLRHFFDDVHAELRRRRLDLPPGKLSRAFLALVSTAIGQKDRARLARLLPEPLREPWGATLEA
jgi:uncharacterized protein (DUF2267 family)